MSNQYFRSFFWFFFFCDIEMSNNKKLRSKDDSMWNYIYQVTINFTKEKEQEKKSKS